GHEHAARHRRLDRVDRSRSWLFLADSLRRGVQEADRRDSERLAKAHTSAAIALHLRQSLWSGAGSGSLGSGTSTANADNENWPRLSFSTLLNGGIRHARRCRSRPKSGTHERAVVFATRRAWAALYSRVARPPSRHASK